MDFTQGQPSMHIPWVSGGEVVVVGEHTVDTGLRELQTFLATFNIRNFLPDEESNLTWYQVEGTNPVQVVLRLEKGGINDGDLGTNPVPVSWFALGK
jgi:hypothetical protein